MTDPKDRGPDPTPAVAAGATYDAFLSHNSDDKPAVLELARRLRDAGLEPFLDAWHLVPGEPWQEALEAAIDASRTCVVFVGPAGFGTWENEEMRAALSRRVGNPEFRVIPAILPGAVLPDRGRLPRFLSRLTWVDFRSGLDDAAAFDRLVDGIRGVAPDALDESELGDAPIVCPFRGLEVFDEDHADYFFGREALTQYLVEQLRSDRFLAVVGASGSGKSSVVRAGLVPQIRGGALTDSAAWPVVIVRPGAHPMEALASRLGVVLQPGADALAARQSILVQLRENERGLQTVIETTVAAQDPDWRVLIVVDQFEEVFTLCHDDAEREAFVDALLHASSVVGGQCVVVVTMRADFFGRCATLPVLAARLAERDVLVPPMEEEDLRRCIVEPAEKVGLQYEKGLVDTILEELGKEPGSLPLLEHTLLELFEGRRGRWMTIDRYREIGGVQGAIAQRAEAVYANFTPEQQAAARRVLMRLTEPGEGTEDTRRRAAVTELLPTNASSDAVEAVVNQLADARLLVTSESDTGDEIVDVAHEALIRGWPRLQGWISENPIGLRIHRRLTETSLEWDAAKRDPSYLYAGQRLVDAQRWAGDNDEDMNEVERAFLAASEAARQHEEMLRRRRIQLAIGGTTVAMVLIAVAAIAAFANLGRAEAAADELERQLVVSEQRRVVSEGQGLASEGERLSPDDPLLGLRLEAEGLERAKATPTVSSDIRSTLVAQLGLARTDYLGDGIVRLWVTPDARYAIVETRDDSTLWRLADRMVIKRLAAPICNVLVPTGNDVGVAQITYGTACDVADTEGVTEVRTLADGDLVEAGPDGALESSADPSARAGVLVTGNGDVLIALTDARQLASADDLTLLAGVDRAIARDNGRARLLDSTDGTEIEDLGELKFVMTDENNGTGFVTIGADESCTLWSTDRAAPVAKTSYCQGLEMSPDGNAAAVWTPDDVQLIAMATGDRLATLEADLRQVHFAPDAEASTLVVIAADGAVSLRETRGGKVLVRFAGTITEDDLLPPEDGMLPPRVAYSNDGELVFVRPGDDGNLEDRRATLRWSSTGAPVTLSDSVDDDGINRVLDVTFSPDPASRFILSEAENGQQGLFLRSGASFRDLERAEAAWFLPPPIGLVIAQNYAGTIDVRRWDTGTLVSSFEDHFEPSVVGHPEVDPPLAVVTWGRLLSEDDRHPVIVDANGRPTVLDQPDTLNLSPDPHGSWYVNGTSVWSRLPKPKHLADLPVSIQETHFDASGHRLVTRDLSSTRAYLVDMDWLAELASVDWTMSDAALIDLVCRGPAGRLVDPVALRDAMKDLDPMACQ